MALEESIDQYTFGIQLIAQQIHTYTLSEQVEEETQSNNKGSGKVDRTQLIKFEMNYHLLLHLILVTVILD